MPVYQNCLNGFDLPELKKEKYLLKLHLFPGKLPDFKIISEYWFTPGPRPNLLKNGSTMLYKMAARAKKKNIS